MADVRIRNMKEETHIKLKIMALERRTTLEKLMNDLMEKAVKEDGK